MASAFCPRRHKMPTRMDAAVPADAQTAPTGTWKTAPNAVSHSAHTLYSLTSPTHKKPDTPGAWCAQLLAARVSHSRHSAPGTRHPAPSTKHRAPDLRTRTAADYRREWIILELGP